MSTQQTIAIPAETLLALPIDALIALYNAESKRLAHGLEAHQVDNTCKPLYIVKRLARLSVYYQMMADELSNEAAATRPEVEEVAERPSMKASRDAEKVRENAALNGDRCFNLMR